MCDVLFFYYIILVAWNIVGHRWFTGPVAKSGYHFVAYVVKPLLAIFSLFWPKTRYPKKFLIHNPGRISYFELGCPKRRLSTFFRGHFLSLREVIWSFRDQPQPTLNYLPRSDPLPLLLLKLLSVPMYVYNMQIDSKHSIRSHQMEYTANNNEVCIHLGRFPFALSTNLPISLFSLPSEWRLMSNLIWFAEWH